MNGKDILRSFPALHVYDLHLGASAELSGLCMIPKRRERTVAFTVTHCKARKEHQHQPNRAESFSLIVTGALIFIIQYTSKGP